MGKPAEGRSGGAPDPARRTRDAVPPGPARRAGDVALGPALRRAWVGYRLQLDEAMAAAGFADDAFPDGRVLTVCSRHPVVTVSEIGRELGITRQGASKIVGRLRERGYVVLDRSPVDGREKIVRLTDRADAYLATRRRAARAIERRVRRQIGDAAFEALATLLDTLGGEDPPRLSGYLHSRGLDIRRRDEP